MSRPDLHHEHKETQQREASGGGDPAPAAPTTMMGNAASQVGVARLQKKLIQRRAAATASPGAAARTDAAPTDPEIESALAWAKGADAPGVEAVRAIQEALDIALTGVYDAATARAVWDKQRESGLRPDGRAGPAFFDKMKVIFTRSIPAAGEVSDAVASDLEKSCPDGVDVAIYTEFEIRQEQVRDRNGEPVTNPDGTPRMRDIGGDREFVRKAQEFATRYRSVAVVNDQVVIGKPYPLKKGVGELVTIVQGIHKSLVARAATAARPGDGKGEKDRKPPNWTRVKNLAIFTHGLEYGIGTNIHGHTFVDGLRKENVRSFVTQIADAVTSDVGVQLYACLTGHEKDFDDPVEKDARGSPVNLETGSKEKKPPQGETRGERSFAARLADELHAHGAHEANVYGHTTAAHTTQNYNARVFGHDATGATQIGVFDDGGLHLFDLIYPDSLIRFELAQLVPDYEKKTEVEKNGYHERMRDQLWRHFIDCTSGERQRKDALDETRDPERRRALPPVRIGRDMGMELFRDPDQARSILLADWHAHWLPLHQDEILQPRRSTRRRGAS